MLADNTMRTLLNIAIYVALIAVILPYFVLLLPLAGAAFLLVYAVFRATIRRLQRLQLESFAPLITHVDASVRGLASLHAYDRLSDFQTRCAFTLSLAVADPATVPSNRDPTQSLTTCEQVEYPPPPSLQSTVSELLCLSGG